MSPFSDFFRTRQQEHEKPRQLPPRPSQTATLSTLNHPADTTFLNMERDLEGKTRSEMRIPAHDGFESLCKRFEQQLLELQSLRLAHEEDVNTIKALQSAHQQDVRVSNTLRNQLSQIATESKQNLKNVTTQKNQLVSHKDKIIAELRAELRQQQKASANREKDRTKEQKLLEYERNVASKASARADKAVEEQRLLCEQVAKGAKADQGFPRGILRSSFAARPVNPFVVILIDGDAYKFARDLMQDHLLGGARAAERLRFEVFKYMVKCNTIPLHSKIIVRVFFNAGSQRGKLGRDGLRGTPAVHTFMIQFSETHPLFDFLDCGSGRERADTKLKQNFELFIDNPYCRGMFLAVCYDAGFVRMLEPYQHLKDALDKIVLIKAGNVAPGFLSVPLFRFTEFPSVFQELYSIKVGPIGKSSCIAHEPKPADVDVRSTLCNNAEQEPEDLPIKDLAHVPWSHPRRYIRSTATLLGLAYKDTLLSVATRGAMPTPELVALHVLSFRLCGRNDGPVTSTRADDKRRVKSNTKALESVIRQKKQAGKQNGISSGIRKWLGLTVRRLEDELTQLKRADAEKPKSNQHKMKIQ